MTFLVTHLRRFRWIPRFEYARSKHDFACELKWLWFQVCLYKGIADDLISEYVQAALDETVRRFKEEAIGK